MYRHLRLPRAPMSQTGKQLRSTLRRYKYCPIKGIAGRHPFQVYYEKAIELSMLFLY